MTIQHLDCDGKIQLIVHIGAGKTGSTSIQETLRVNQKLLSDRGVFYLGLMLENVHPHQYNWQHAAGGSSFLLSDPSICSTQLYNVLVRTVETATKNGYHKLIWSNEQFLRRSNQVIPVLKRLCNSMNIHVLVVCYVRRHDAWARSAYVQWGLKHKTYSGPLMPFHQWIKQNQPQFFPLVFPWYSNYEDNFLLRNMDKVKDVVSDFIRLCQLDMNDFKIKRQNEAPTEEEVLLRAIFNGQHNGIVQVTRYNQIIGSLIEGNKTANDYLEYLLPTDSDLRKVQLEQIDDRTALNHMLVEKGQETIDISPLPKQENHVSVEKLVMALCQVVVGQAQKIANLEELVKL